MGFALPGSTTSSFELSKSLHSSVKSSHARIQRPDTKYDLPGSCESCHPSVVVGKTFVPSWKLLTMEKRTDDDNFFLYSRPPTVKLVLLVAHIFYLLISHYRFACVLKQ